MARRSSAVQTEQDREPGYFYGEQARVQTYLVLVWYRYGVHVVDRAVRAVRVTSRLEYEYR